jgi:2'-5' RNA ligase
MKIMLALKIPEQAKFKALQKHVANHCGNKVPSLEPHITLTIPIKCEHQSEKYFVMHKVARQVSNIARPFPIATTDFGSFYDRVLYLGVTDVPSCPLFSHFLNLVNAVLEFNGHTLHKMELGRKAHITIAKEFPSGTANAYSAKQIAYEYEEDAGEDDDRFFQNNVMTLSSIQVYAKDDGDWFMEAEYPFLVSTK